MHQATQLRRQLFQAKAALLCPFLCLKNVSSIRYLNLHQSSAHLHHSKLLSDSVFGTSLSPLNLSHVPCCGLEWLLCDGTSGSLASNGLLCLDVTTQQVVTLSRATFRCGTSLCPCKALQRNQTGECLLVQNWTVGVQGTCQNASCPIGHRLYHTGSTLVCHDPSQCYVTGCNLITLFETACQGELD
jgi:hypothetical protein